MCNDWSPRCTPFFKLISNVYHTVPNLNIFRPFCAPILMILQFGSNLNSAISQIYYTEYLNWYTYENKMYILLSSPCFLTDYACIIPIHTANIHFRMLFSFFRRRVHKWVTELINANKYWSMGINYGKCQDYILSLLLACGDMVMRSNIYLLHGDFVNVNNECIVLFSS